MGTSGEIMAEISSIREKIKDIRTRMFVLRDSL